MPASPERCALVVEEDPIILMDAVDILAGTRFRVLEAASGDEAKLVLADQGGLTTLLDSDVEMPGPTNGFALLPETCPTAPQQFGPFDCKLRAPLPYRHQFQRA